MAPYLTDRFGNPSSAHEVGREAVVTLLGLGLSIDYGLLLVNRYPRSLFRRTTGRGARARLGDRWAHHPVQRFDRRRGPLRLAHVRPARTVHTRRRRNLRGGGR